MRKKQVVITGASKGIGLSIAQTLAKEGYFVLGIGRSPANVCASNFKYLAGDINDSELIKKIVQESKDTKVLINNAGVGYFRPLENLRPTEIQEMIRTDLLAPILLTQALLKNLKKNQGYVINIGSKSAYEGAANGTVYCAVKFGLRGFSEALWSEVRKHGIKVCSIHTSAVRSSFFDDKNFEPEDCEDSYVLPQDVAETVCHILKMRPGSVMKDIQLYPQRKVWVKK